MFKTVSKPLAHLNFLSGVNCYDIGSITNQRRCFAKKLEAQEGLKKKFDQEVVSAKNSEKLYAQLFPKMMFNRILCITAIRRRVTRISESFIRVRHAIRYRSLLITVYGTERYIQSRAQIVLFFISSLRLI